MMAEFQWWLLIVGIVIGGGLTSVVLFDGARRDEDIAEAELPSEAAWVWDRIAMDGHEVDAGLIEAVLRAHRSYRQLPSPDRIPSAGLARATDDPPPAG